jgi:protein-S-isoprenylcysteine O-methyltransferase Ste14
MAREQSGDRRAMSQTNHWPTTVAALVVGASFFALWFWLLPGWLGFRVETADASRWRWLAAVPSVLGFAVALRCVWDFGWTGHGTPAPVAPPQRLVVVGFYRYVRNPMYVGFAAGWIGLWVVFGHANPVAIAIVVTVALGVHLVVIFYEEPTLRRKFGTDYDDYCRNVSRWWPRLRGWDTRPYLRRTEIRGKDLHTQKSNLITGLGSNLTGRICLANCRVLDAGGRRTLFIGRRFRNASSICAPPFRPTLLSRTGSWRWKEMVHLTAPLVHWGRSCLRTIQCLPTLSARD